MIIEVETTADRNFASKVMCKDEVKEKFLVLVKLLLQPFRRRYNDSNSTFKLSLDLFKMKKKHKRKKGKKSMKMYYLQTRTSKKTKEVKY